MPRADAEPVFGIHEAQGGKGVVVIQERLPLPHGDHIAHAHAHVVTGEHDLIDHFARREVSHEAFLAGRAERAPDGTAYLRGKAHGESLRAPLRVLVLRWHGDGLHTGAVIELPYVLARAVFRYATIEHGGHGERRALSELGSQRFWQVGHVVIRPNPTLVHPLNDLFRAETRLPQRLEQLLEAFPRICLDSVHKPHYRVRLLYFMRRYEAHEMRMLRRAPAIVQAQERSKGHHGFHQS